MNTISPTTLPATADGTAMTIDCLAVVSNACHQSFGPILVAALSRLTMATATVALMPTVPRE